MSEQLGSIQFESAEPAAYYTATTARCVCQDTITLQVDGAWRHGSTQISSCKPR